MIHTEVAESWSEVIELCAGLEENADAVKNAIPGSVVIFGAGTQGKVAIRYFNKQGIKIRCFTDNDPDKHGILIDGIPVVPPHDPAVLSAPIILIATRQSDLTLRRQIDDMQIANLSFDAFFIANNKDRISHVHNNLLSDERSRLSYDAILKTMLIGNNFQCAPVMEGNQYFALPEFVNIGNDHFVDAGAYVGDTLEKFIWTNSGIFMKVYAFEPGEIQLTAMKHRVERLCREWAIPKSAIICENAGLQDNNTTLSLTMSNVLANASFHIDCHGNASGGGDIPCYSLDNYLNGRPAIFIKTDIKGMELAMLIGAKETIRKYKPKMTLSIYHNPAHLFEIAEYVNDLIHDYYRAVRHHSPIFAESVLYCWMPQESSEKI